MISPKEALDRAVRTGLPEDWQVARDLLIEDLGRSLAATFGAVDALRPRTAVGRLGQTQVLAALAEAVNGAREVLHERLTPGLQDEDVAVREAHVRALAEVAKPLGGR